MIRSMLRITSPDLRNSYVVIIYATLHEIHLMISYVVIICANSCQRLTKTEIDKVEIGSNIAQNRLFSR